jgi:hypothetical protein
MEQQTDEFENVRRWMALKRRETPPPGYFRDFSSRVTDRIARDEARRAEPWWKRISDAASWRPSLVGANALIGAGLALIVATAVSVRHSKPAAATAAFHQPFATANAGMDPSRWIPSTTLAGDRPYRTEGVRYQIQIVPLEGTLVSNRLPASIIAPPDFPVVPASWNGGH